MGLFSNTSKSSTVSTPQSLNLGAPSFGGSSYGIELGNAPKLTSANIYLTPPAQSSLQSMFNKTTLSYVALAAGAYLVYRMLR